MTEQFKESINDLKNQLATFIKDYYEELLKIWKKLTELETRQKMSAIIYGGMSGILFSIITALIVKYWIK